MIRPLTKALALLLVLVSVGCSSVNNIAQANHDSTVKVETILKEAEALAKLDIPEIQPHVAAIAEAAVDIEDNCKTIADNLGGIDDKTPQWLIALGKIATIVGYAAGIGLIGFLVYIGVGSFLRPLMKRMGILVEPTPEEGAAKLLNEAMKSASIEEVKAKTAQATAILRTKNKNINKAFTRMSRKDT